MITEGALMSAGYITDDILNILNNSQLLNRILENYNIEYDIICYLKGPINRYTLSYCKSDIIDRYIKYYTYDQLIELDDVQRPMLFSFLKSENIISYLLDKFKNTNILNILDNFKQNIYYYCFKLNCFLNWIRYCWLPLMIPLLRYPS